MIRVKSLFDAVELDDGDRIWIEPIGLTRDLQEWCHVDHCVAKLAPSKRLAEWFENHAGGYDYFRAKYHAALRSSSFFPVLQRLAQSAIHENFTLLHSSDHYDANAATALMDLILELQATCPPEA